MSQYQGGFETIPGVSAVIETAEIDLTWFNTTQHNRFDGGKVLAASVDAGNTPTTQLRAGLLLGFIASSNSYTQWTPGASNGAEKIAGVLARTKSTLESGVAADHFVGSIITDGYLKNDNLLIPGESTYGLSGKDLEFVVRDQLAERFLLDDIRNPLIPRNATLIADKTIDGTWHGATINNIGATGTVVVTLPAPKQGFRLRLRQFSNQILQVATPSAGQLKLSDGTTAQTLNLAAATNKVMDIYGIGSTYHAVIYGATS
jgi:hypothetical protein